MAQMSISEGGASGMQRAASFEILVLRVHPASNPQPPRRVIPAQAGIHLRLLAACLIHASGDGLMKVAEHEIRKERIDSRLRGNDGLGAMPRLR